MKLYSLCICFALALPYFCTAQINMDTITKKVNVIEIFTGLSMEDNFSLVGQAIAEKDWEIAQANKEFGQIVTGLITIKTLIYRFRFLIKEDKIRLTGDFNLIGFSEIRNIGMKGSPNKLSFEVMLNLAQKIAPTGSKLTFSITQ